MTMNMLRLTTASLLCLAAFCPAMAAAQAARRRRAADSPMVKMEEARQKDWLARWEKNILPGRPQ